jgi:integrase
MQPAPAASLVPQTAPDDRALIELWLQTKVSPHTQRAYRAEVERFRGFIAKPLAWVTLADLHGYREHLGQGSLKPASQNRALTALKSLLSFGHETGYLPFNVGAAVKLRPNRDPLAGRILVETDIARLIEAACEGRDRMLLTLLYQSGVRVGELAAVKWCDVQPRGDAGQLTVFGKGGRTRSILLKPSAWQALGTLRGEAASMTPSSAAARPAATWMCRKSAALSTPPPAAPASRRRSPPTGCATLTPAMRLIAGLPSTSSKPLWGTPPWPPLAATFTRAPPTPLPFTCPIDGASRDWPRGTIPGILYA